MHNLNLKGKSWQIFKNTVQVTALALLAQGINFCTQILLAALLGAKVNMDAFITANTLPQYITSVFLASFSFGFIPIYVDYIIKGQGNEAGRFVIAITSLMGTCLIVVSSLGMIFARQLIMITTPGLSQVAINLATQVAYITWLSVIPTGFITILVGVYQANHRFAWAAFVPVVGSIVNLGLVVILFKQYQVIGVALAATGSLFLQAILLLPIVIHNGIKFPVNLWKHEGVYRTIKLMLPLILSGILVRWVPVLERYLASQMIEGTISRINYTVKLLTPMAMVISSGFSTVLFPSMSFLSAEGDLDRLKKTTSLSIRLMLMALMPVIAIGIALSHPFIQIIYQRGAFGNLDTEVVASLLQITLLALFGMCLGDLVTRTFYAMKDTKTSAIVGVLIALLYAIYTPILVRYLDWVGLGIGFVIYNNLPLFVMLIILRQRIAKKGGKVILITLVKISSASFLAGSVVFYLTLGINNLFLKLLTGGIVGIIIYLVVLLLIKVPEMQLFINVIDVWKRNSKEQIEK